VQGDRHAVSPWFPSYPRVSRGHRLSWPRTRDSGVAPMRCFWQPTSC